MNLPGSAIRYLRKAKGMTLQDLADKIGADTGNLSRLEHGKQDPSMETLQQIANALQATLADLFQMHEERAEYNVDGAAIQLTSRLVPMVGTAQLGDDGFWYDFEYPVGHGDGNIEYPTSDKNAYAVRVKGDSMRPRIRPGEFVIVEPNAQCEHGREVLVKTKDGRAMVKILRSQREGMVELTSINEDHPPMTIEERDIEHMHYVAGIANSKLYRGNR